MSDSDNKMGIIVTNLPNINQSSHIHGEEVQQLIDPVAANWYSISSQKSYEAAFLIFLHDVLTALRMKTHQSALWTGSRLKRTTIFWLN